LGDILTEQLGDRGLTTVRRFGKTEFEELYGSNVGFDDAFLCFSQHYAWGARDEGVRVLEIFMDLDLVPNSYAIDKSQDHPMLVIHPEFRDRIRSLFSIFYTPENEEIFTKNSALATAFEGSNDFDWKTPEVIAIYMNFHIDGEPQVFPIMENSNEWSDEEHNVEFDDAAKYIEYCSKRYTAFLETYEQAFDEDGRPKV
jgi:hypothetical protein